VKLFDLNLQKKPILAQNHIMCGRFSLVASKEKIQQELPFVDVGINLRSSYNIAPTQHAYIVTNDNPERLQYITWGLIPYWSKDGKNNGKLINARREGIENKPSFRIPLRQRRCLVLADSFYEWRREGIRKIPHRIFLKDGKLMLMAGIWDVWYKGDYALKSFSIITMPSTSQVASIHSRMPVLLTSSKRQSKWLEATDLDDILSVLKTSEEEIFNIFRVSDLVNSIRNDSPALHKKVPEAPRLF